jgi:TRAP-type C4-dicarboxylate transport system permease small subunit
MIGLIKKADEFLASVEKVLITVLSGALVLILMSQVILRYVFSRPLFWAEEISVQLMVFITLIGLSLLLKARQMIAIDMIINALPRNVKVGLIIVLQLVSLAVIVFFAYQGTLWILRPEVRMELSPTTGLPIWVNYAMMPITFYCMAFHLAAGLATSTYRKPS